MNDKLNTIQLNETIALNEKDIKKTDNNTIVADIDTMLAFTEAYQSLSGKPAQREAACFVIQLKQILSSVRDDQLIVGHIRQLPIGFLPQAPNGLGYYMDKNEINTILESKSLSTNKIDQIKKLVHFWETHTTKNLIENKYDSEKLKYLSLCDFSESGIAFPLYRISGIHMSPTRLLKLGFDSMIDLFNNSLHKNYDMFCGMIMVIKALQDACISLSEQCKILSNKTLEKERKTHLCTMAENLQHIAHYPPKTFWQAIQLLWIFYLVSGTYNYGRMDDDLGTYLVHDLNDGILTEEQAIQIMDSLWERIYERETTWDARVILGGKGRIHPNEADHFAMLALEVTRRKHQTIPQLTLRCTLDMNKEVYAKALAVIGEGCTYPLLYNDEVNIPAVMKAFHADEETANNYLPFGCGEYIIHNQSVGTPSGAINLVHALNKYITEEKALINHKSFHSFYNGFLAFLNPYILVLAQQEKLEYDVAGEQAAYLCYSMMFDDCIACAKPLLAGGVRYMGGTLETYGNTNTSDSLTAIKQLVYELKTVSSEEMTNALNTNFKETDDIRVQALSVPKFGNDDTVADNVARRFHIDLCQIVIDAGKKVGLDSYLAVIINNSMNTTFGLATGASADGRQANTFFANANNPTGGMDRCGITAMLNSLVKLPTNIHAGSVQNMRFSKELFTTLLPKTQALLSTYFENGGSQAMITVLNRGDLEKARQNPEQYRNLMVRVGGFSAKFVELSEAVQLEIMSRTLYE